MIESRLLVAKPFAFLLNSSRSRLLYLSRSGEATAYTTAPLPRLASGKASTLLASLALACAKASSIFARSKSFRQSERSDPTEIPHIEFSAADMRLRLGDHIMPSNTFICIEGSPRYTDRIDVHG